jgi:6-phospho-beta-glucosidase
MARIAVMGGSGVATPELVAAFARRPGPDLDVTLIGRTAGRLEKVAAVCRAIAAGRPGLRIAATTDAAAGLQGADFVVNQVRVGGVEARAFDETFPLEFGFPGEETVGPGGFANALRTIPAVLESARLVERVAPQALFVNFTNPTSFVQYAVSRYTGLATLGLCDSPVSLVAGVATAVGVPAAGLAVDYVGMHHFGWIVAAYHDGRDVLPRALENAAAITGLGIAPEVVRALGVVPHFYYRYFAHGDEIAAQQRGAPPRARQLAGLQQEILAAYDGPTDDALAALSRRGARWYELVVAPVLSALIERSTSSHIVNVVNGSTLPWLPAEAVVETPALLAQGVVRPLPPRAVPAAVQALVAANCSYEMAAVEAIVERSHERALRALLLHPMHLTWQQAQGILARVWPDGGVRADR